LRKTSKNPSNNFKFYFVNYIYGNLKKKNKDTEVPVELQF
jgi:hypothetical protein